MGLDVIYAGPDTAGSPDPIRDAVYDAYHQAGPVVARTLLRRTFHRVTLGGGPARVEFTGVDLVNDDQREREVICAMAGIATEVKADHGEAAAKALHDVVGDDPGIRTMHGVCASDAALIERLRGQALGLVTAHAAAIDHVVGALLIHGDLFPQDVFDAGMPFRS